MAKPFEKVAGVGKNVEEGGAGRIIAEGIFLVVAAGGDVVNGSGKLDG